MNKELLAEVTYLRIAIDELEKNTNEEEKQIIRKGIQDSLDNIEQVGLQGTMG